VQLRIFHTFHLTCCWFWVVCCHLKPVDKRGQAARAQLFSSWTTVCAGNLGPTLYHNYHYRCCWPSWPFSWRKTKGTQLKTTIIRCSDDLSLIFVLRDLFRSQIFQKGRLVPACESFFFAYLPHCCYGFTSVRQLKLYKSSWNISFSIMGSGYCFRCTCAWKAVLGRLRVLFSQCVCVQWVTTLCAKEQHLETFSNTLVSFRRPDLFVWKHVPSTLEIRGTGNFCLIQKLSDSSALLSTTCDTFLATLGRCLSISETLFDIPPATGKLLLRSHSSAEHLPKTNHRTKHKKVKHVAVCQEIFNA